MQILGGAIKYQSLQGNFEIKTIVNDWIYALSLSSELFTMGSEDGDDHENYPDGNMSIFNKLISNIGPKERNQRRSLTLWWENSPWKNWKRLLGSNHFHIFHSFIISSQNVTINDLCLEFLMILVKASSVSKDLG